jgi:hypothetical protein
MTPCIQEPFPVASVGSREVVARFDGGPVVSDGGALLLGEVERQANIWHRLAAGLIDQRDPLRIEHTVEALIRQRL